METRDEFEKEQEEIRQWKPPSPHKVQFQRRVFQIEGWVRATGWVHAEDVIRYAMKHFNVEREQAQAYLKQVIEDFERKGVRVLDQSR